MNKEELEALEASVKRKKLLSEALEKGNLELVKSIMEGDKYDDNDFSRAWGSPLENASKNGHFHIVQYLHLKKNNFKKDNPKPVLWALFYAAQNGHLVIVEFLVKHILENELDINHKVGIVSSMDIAARNGHFSVVEFLYKNGAKIGNALHEASAAGFLPIAEYLLKNKADVNGKDLDHSTPLLWVVKYNCQVRVIEYLLKNGARIDDRDSQNFTALHLALERSDKAKLEAFKYLLDRVDLDAIQEKNDSASDFFSLIFQPSSAYRGLLSGLKPLLEAAVLLLERGAYIDILAEQKKQDLISRMALFWSAHRLFDYDNQSNFLDLDNTLKILSVGLNGRQRKTGDTALYVAIQNNNKYLAQRLLQHGASVLIKNHSGKTGLDLIRLYCKNDPFLYVLGHATAIIEMDSNLRYRQKNNLKLEGTIKKEIKETKEVKEIKERKENKEEIEQKSKIEENNKIYLENCQLYLKEIESNLDKLPVDQANFVCLSLGWVIGKQDSVLFYPAFAYFLLSRVADSKEALEKATSDREGFEQTHKLLLEILLSVKIIFKYDELTSEMKPILNDNNDGLENESPVEDEQGRAFRIFKIITHMLYTETVHDDSFGKYIAEYTLGSEKSIEGIQGIKGKSIETQLSLIKMVREQAEALKKREAELQAKNLLLKENQIVITKTEVLLKSYDAKLKEAEERIQKLEQERKQREAIIDIKSPTTERAQEKNTNRTRGFNCRIL